MNTYGSLFSCDPNIIIDFNAFQSCKTRSNASWANLGGSKSWSGISESKKVEEIVGKTEINILLFMYHICQIYQPSGLAVFRLRSSLIRGGLYWQCSTVCLATVCTKNSKRCSPLQKRTLLWRGEKGSQMSWAHIWAVLFPFNLRPKKSHLPAVWQSDQISSSQQAIK